MNKINWNFVSASVAVLMAIGVFAGFWLSRERDLWQAVNNSAKLQLLDQEMHNAETRLTRIEGELKIWRAFFKKEEHQE